MPDPIVFNEDRVFISATEVALWDGCDWTLYCIALFGCFLLAIAALAICGKHLLALIPCGLVIVGLFFSIRALLQMMARKDPLHFVVYRRAQLYKSTYAAHSKLLPLDTAPAHSIRPIVRVVPKRKSANA